MEERERERRERGGGARKKEKDNFGKSVCGSTQVLSSWACAHLAGKAGSP